MRVLAGLLLCVLGVTPLLAADCLQFGYNPGHTNYTQETLTFPLSLEWKFAQPPEPSRTSPVVAEALVFWTTGAYIFGIDQESGAATWALKATAEVNGSPCYYDGKVIVGTDDGQLLALRSGDGQVAWTARVGWAARTALALVDGTVYCATRDNKVVSVDAATGSINWTTIVKDAVSAPVVVAGGYVFAPAMDSNLYGLDAASGQIRWSYRAPTRMGLTLPPVAGERHVYLAAESALVAVGLRGMPAWRVDFKDKLPVGPSYANGLVYQPGPDGVIYAFDADSGKLRWQRKAMFMSCSVAIAGPLLITASNSGLVRAYDAKTGEAVWEYHTWHPLLVKEKARGEDYVPLLPPVVAGGNLYITTAAGELFKLSPSASDLAPPEAFSLQPEEGKPASGRFPLKVGARVFDEGSGIDTKSLTLSLDGELLPAEYRTVGSELYFYKNTPAGAALADGWHTVELHARDLRGNEMVKTWQFYSDQKYAPTAPPKPAGSQEPGIAPGAPPEPERGGGIGFGRGRN
jgi:outer membrane protein assembly factor BamB